jgi:hypothetical protein
MEEREKSSVKIPDNPEDVTDINFLKQKGIESLQELTGKKWTDFNVHDPGITILEILCFALTELGYRSGYPIEDLFASPSTGEPVHTANFDAHKILVSGAITELDYRKIVLDIDGINNVEFRPAKDIFEFKGLFDVFVELENHNLTQEKRQVLELEIREQLLNNRGVCMHFNDVFFLESELIKLDINIELNRKIDTAEFLFELVKTLENYFSPAPKFSTIDTLISSGLIVEDIYLGPLLKNGFIRDDEVIEHELRKNIYVSDILNIVMSLDGVHHIKKMNLSNENDEEFNWIYEVKSKCVPRLDISRSSVSVSYKGKHAYSISLKEFFPENVSFKNKIGNSHKSNKINQNEGKIKELKSYTSIVNDFPEIYGLSRMGMPEGSTKNAIASTKQLRVYLMFFDQIMANYLAQLDHLKYLFSLNDLNTTNAIQVLEDFPGVYYVYKPFLDHYLRSHQDLNDELSLRKSWKKYVKENRKQLELFIGETKENKEVFSHRRNKILDHLLARYGYDYSSFDVVSLLNESELIDLKTNFLRQLCETGYAKFQGVEKLSHVLHKNSGYEKYFSSMFGFYLNQKQLISSQMTGMLTDSQEHSEVVSLEFKDINMGEAIQKLLRYGNTSSNYDYDSKSLFLSDFDGKLFCEFSISNQERTSDIHPIIKKMTDRIYRLSRESEAFYFLEHSFLRPTDEMKVYGLNIHMDENVIFSSDSHYTRKNRDTITHDFQLSLRDKASYEIMELSMSQFKIKWSSGGSSMLSTHFFNDAQEAEIKLDEYISYFQSQKNLESIYDRTTIFSSMYNEVVDPFSNIVSFIFPNWPHRFQNEAFKNFILENIKNGLPAHIVPNIGWISLEKMICFEELIKEYSKESNKSPKERLDQLKDVLNFLTSIE